MIKPRQNNPVMFALTFVILFLGFYYFNLAFFGITSPGKLYSPFLANHLNYISSLRHLLLWCSTAILKFLGFATIYNDQSMRVAGHGMIMVVYSCLGLGVMSFFVAFVIAYPKPLKAKFIFGISGILVIQFLNVIRFVLLALFWDNPNEHIIDHHTIFNALIYLIIAIGLYFWVTAANSPKRDHAKN